MATSQAQPLAADEESDPRYNIDMDWFERNPRSHDEMIAGRVADLDAPATKGAAKRKKAAPTPSMADLAKMEGFINPQLPLLEAVFRLMLVHQNKPLGVGQISQELAEAGLGIKDSRLVNPEVISRMVESDAYYGFQKA